MHVDLLKAPHHGSEHNFSLEFAQKVTADQYLFCANGAHHNPDLDAVRRLLDARIGSDARRTPFVDADRPFRLWFTSDGTTERADREHMECVVALVTARIDGMAHVTAHFSGGAYFDIEL